MASSPGQKEPEFTRIDLPTVQSEEVLGSGACVALGGGGPGTIDGITVEAARSAVVAGGGSDDGSPSSPEGEGGPGNGGVLSGGNPSSERGVAFSTEAQVIELLKENARKKKLNRLSTFGGKVLTAIREKKKDLGTSMSVRRLRRARSGDDMVSSTRKAVHERMLQLQTSERILPDSPTKRTWDLILMAMCLYHAIVSPLCTFGTLEMWSNDIGIIVEVIVAFIFLLDIPLNLNLAFVDEHNQLKEDLHVIRKRYLNPMNIWIWIDVISVIPFGVFHQRAAIGNMIKLVKVQKFFKLSNPDTISTSYVAFYFHYVPKLLASFWFIVGLHFVVCVKIAIGGETYPLALFWCWSMLTSAPISLEIESSGERVFGGLLMVLAIILQAFVLGVVSVTMMKKSVKDRQTEKMRQILSIMNYYKVPKSLQGEVLSFQFHSLQQDISTNYKAAFDGIPDIMQREINLYVKIKLISEVPLFSKAAADCRILLAYALSPVLVEPDHIIIQHGTEGKEMYFMTHGYADVIIPTGATVHTLKRGDFFGEIALLMPNCPRTATIKALTYCDLFRLNREDFFTIIEDFPEFKAHVQQESEHRIAEQKAKQAAAEKKDQEKKEKEKDNVIRRLSVSAGAAVQRTIGRRPTVEHAKEKVRKLYPNVSKSGLLDGDADTDDKKTDRTALLRILERHAGSIDPSQQQLQPGGPAPGLSSRHASEDLARGSHRPSNDVGAMTTLGPPTGAGSFRLAATLSHPPANPSGTIPHPLQVAASSTALRNRVISVASFRGVGAIGGSSSSSSSSSSTQPQQSPQAAPLAQQGGPGLSGSLNLLTTATNLASSTTTSGGSAAVPVGLGAGGPSPSQPMMGGAAQMHPSSSKAELDLTDELRHHLPPIRGVKASLDSSDPKRGEDGLPPMSRSTTLQSTDNLQAQNATTEGVVVEHLSKLESLMTSMSDEIQAMTYQVSRTNLEVSGLTALITSHFGGGTAGIGGAAATTEPGRPHTSPTTVGVRPSPLLKSGTSQNF